MSEMIFLIACSFFLACGMFAGAIVLGYALHFLMYGANWRCKEIACKKLPLPYAALMGVFGYSTVYAMLGLLGNLNLFKLSVTLLLIIGAAFALGLRLNLKRFRSLPEKVAKYKGIYFLLLPAIGIGFLTASLPTSNWDAISYVLTIPKLHIESQNLRYLDEYGVFSSFPIFGEAIFGISLLLNPHPYIAQFFPYLFLPVLLWLSTQLFASYSSNQEYQNYSLLSVAYLPLILMNLGIAKIEIIQASFLLAATVLILKSQPNRFCEKTLLSFLFLSFACGLKYTTIFYIPLYLVFYFQNRYPLKLSILLKESLVLAVMGVVINLPWLTLNLLQHCNPVFPNLADKIGSCRYSQEQLHNISLMIKEATIWQNGTSWLTTHSWEIYWTFLVAALGKVNILVCFFALLGLAYSLTRGARVWKVCLPFASALLILAWQFYFYYWEFRYFYPLLIVLMILSWILISQVELGRSSKYIFASFIILQMFFSITQFKNSSIFSWLYAQGLVSREEFKEKGIHLFWVSEYVNQSTSPQDIIAFNWGVQPFFYLNRSFFFIHDWNPEVGFEGLKSASDFLRLLKTKQVAMLVWRVQDDSRFPNQSISREFHDQLNDYLAQLIESGNLKEEYRRDDVVIYRTNF